MKNKMAVNYVLIAAIISALGFGCKSFGDLGTAGNAPAANSASSNSNVAANSNSAAAPKEPAKVGIISADDPADFTFTAEQSYKEFKNDKNPIKGEKYVDKILAITGRFKDIDVTKKDSSGGYSARLSAGGMFDWVGCSVDEENKAEFTKLTKDQMVTFKGLGDRFWLMGPRLKHCVVADTK